VLSDYHIKYCTQYGVNHSNVLNYECYTSVKHNGILYRADPDWKGMGHEWYDWCVARFVSTLVPTNRTVDRTQRHGTTEDRRIKKHCTHYGFLSTHGLRGPNFQQCRKTRLVLEQHCDIWKR
jgi:hypothetical protein